MRFLDAVIPARAVPRGRFRGQLSGSGFTFGGVTYPAGIGSPLVTTWGKTPVERIGTDFVDYCQGAFAADSAVAAVEALRVSVFSAGRFAWQGFNRGRPGEIFGGPDLGIFERPWAGGKTRDLLARSLVVADAAGNSYTVRVTDVDGVEELVILRPDWVDLLLTPRRVDVPGNGPGAVKLGYRTAGFAYYHDGKRTDPPVVLLADEVAHFAPHPDPLANYRGMSWLTPVVREVMADKAATDHKLAFFENAATPNLAVTLPKELEPDEFREFVELMERDHTGVVNAYRTLYLAGGADPTVIGANMEQLDFKSTQGAGETRIAAAGGVGAVLAKLSEGLAGASLNAGNFSAARRLFADTTAIDLWRAMAGSHETLTRNTITTRELVIDTRDVAFLRDDAKDVAEIQRSEAETIRTLVDAGYTPDSVIAAVESNDWRLLEHSGLYSVQLQAPGSGTAPANA